MRAPLDRAGDGGGLAAAVTVDLDVGGKHALERLHVAVLDRGEELAREPLALLGRRLEPRLALLDAPPGADRELARRLLAAPDDAGDPLVVVVEDLPQQEDRALLRGEALEDDEERERERVG